jgi:hypothetical protein
MWNIHIPIMGYIHYTETHKHARRQSRTQYKYQHSCCSIWLGGAVSIFEILISVTKMCIIRAPTNVEYLIFFNPISAFRSRTRIFLQDLHQRSRNMYLCFSFMVGRAVISSQGPDILIFFLEYLSIVTDFFQGIAVTSDNSVGARQSSNCTTMGDRFYDKCW